MLEVAGVGLDGGKRQVFEQLLSGELVRADSYELGGVPAWSAPSLGL
jgi:hypothetical protein